jgi:membrane associated rhomboid family serine protease
MWYQQQSEDYRPLFWVSGRPIYASALLVIGHVLLFLVCGICIASLGLERMVFALALDTAEVWRGQVWRLLSYISFDPMFFARTSLWFPFNMLVLYFCGREVEQLVGRRSYLAVYAALILVPSILLSLLGLATGSAFEYMTSADAVFGVFIAFATIYPGAMPSMWFSVPVWVIAVLLLAIFTFLDLVNHAWTSMFMLWSCSAVGYLGMRLVGAGRGLRWLTDWIENRRAERLARQHNIKVLSERKSAESLDAILDKISRQGVNSLTPSERAALEKARAKLIDRDRR